MKTNGFKNGRKSGMALLGVLVVTIGLSIIATTGYFLTTTDLNIARNHRTKVAALYQAEAGIAYAKGRVETVMFSEPFAVTGSIPVDISAPAGFTFDPITNVVRLRNRNFAIVAKGRASNSVTAVQAIFRNGTAFSDIGVFGDTYDIMDNGSGVYSYHSSETKTPTIEASTHEAGVGSNEQLTIHNNTYIDGSLMVGADSGVEAGVNNQGMQFAPPVNVGPINPDPLGLNVPGGPLNKVFAAVVAANNNAAAGLASPADFRLSNGETKTFQPGDYYFSDFFLDNGAVLIINNAAGPVRFFITGEDPTHVGNGCKINLNGSAGNFAVFNKGAGTTFLNNSAFVPGIWYAPGSVFKLDNSAQFHGVMWGHRVEIKGKSTVFIDVDAPKNYGATNLTLVSWKELRY